MEQEGWRERLKAALDASPYSVSEASLAAGLSRGYLGRLLREDFSPKIDTLMLLCDLLGVSISYIITGKELSSDADELLKAYYLLPDDAKGLVRVQLKALADAANSGPQSDDSAGQ